MAGEIICTLWEVRYGRGDNLYSRGSKKTLKILKGNQKPQVEEGQASVSEIADTGVIDRALRSLNFRVRFFLFALTKQPIKMLIQIQTVF